MNARALVQSRCPAACINPRSSSIQAPRHMRGMAALRLPLLRVQKGRPACVRTYAMLQAEAPPVRPGSSTPDAKPAELDRQRFQLHPSVNVWRTFDPAKSAESSSSIVTQVQGALQNLQRSFRSSGTSSLLESRDSAAYWAYHIGRMGFFTVQGLAGLLSARSSSAAKGEAEGGTGLRLEKLAEMGIAGPILEALACYQQDYENIKAGLYKLPWDMTTVGHRQTNPLFVLRKAAAFVREAADTLGRRDRQADTSVWLDSRLYPEYYRSTFHYQTDGWMSKESADVYETSTETLFLGKQDAMQRQALVPLHHHMLTRPAGGAGMKVLEVACGTGRFATFIKDNYPEMEMTCLDLSFPYLENARENLNYWRSKRAPNNTTVDNFIQAAAEDIPEEDNSFDVVTSVYLFHELPADVRRKAAAEMARVCKPGGMVVFTDSVQMGDRDAFDATLGRFGNFNEPYYQGYINTDIGQLFEDAGLTPHMKTVSSSTKALSFKKPLQNSTSGGW